MKLKRRGIAAKYADEIAALYSLSSARAGRRSRRSRARGLRLARGFERMTGAGDELGGVERVRGVARDAGRHGERVADRARPQRLAHALGDHDARRARRCRRAPPTATTSPRRNTASLSRSVRHATAPSAVSACVARRRAAPSPGRRAPRTRPRPAAPCAGPRPRPAGAAPGGGARGAGPTPGRSPSRRCRSRRELGRAVVRTPARLLLGDRGLQAVELAGAGGGPAPAPPAASPRRALRRTSTSAPDAGGGDADHRRGEPERRFVGDDRGDAERRPRRTASAAHTRDAAVAVAPGRRRRSPPLIAGGHQVGELGDDLGDAEVLRRVDARHAGGEQRGAGRPRG